MVGLESAKEGTLGRAHRQPVVSAVVSAPLKFSVKTKQQHSKPIGQPFVFSVCFSVISVSFKRRKYELKLESSVLLVNFTEISVVWRTEISVVYLQKFQ